MAEAIGIAGMVGVVGEVVGDLNYLYTAWKASGKLGAEAKRVLNLCKEVKGLLKNAQESSRTIYTLDHVESRLDGVSKIAAKCKDEAKLDRVSHFGVMRSRLDELQVIEGQMGVVLQFLAAHDAA
jgi:ferritin-like protein